jgi:hypothetical protein
VVSALGGEQQPLGGQFVHDGDVVPPAAQAGLIDANDLHRAHVVQRTRLCNQVGSGTLLDTKTVPLTMLQ